MEVKAVAKATINRKKCIGDSNNDLAMIKNAGLVLLWAMLKIA